MKTILLFLILLVFVGCPPSKEKIEEMKIKRKERDKKIEECLLKSEIASEDLKKKIKEKKDEDLIRILYPHGHELDKSDKDAIRDCRREVFRQEHSQMNRDNL